MSDIPGADVALKVGALAGSPSRRRKERWVQRAFQAAALLSVLISVAIVLSLVGRAVTFLTGADLSTLWSSGWFPRRGLFDLRTIVTGTFLIAGIGMFVAIPLGLGSAIYLSEYARPKARRVLKPIIEVLAGIPSVVIGFFALTFISPEIVQRFWPDATLFNMMAAGIGVGILTTPLIATISEDALRAVPANLREAAYGLGSKRRTATMKVVVPAALSGIVASLIVGLSRAIGETMVVAIAAGASGGSALSVDPTSPGQTMTAAMTALAIGSDQVKGAGNAFESLFFVGLLLFLMTLILNVASERFVRRFREKY